jgi:cytochrome c553
VSPTNPRRTSALRILAAFAGAGIAVLGGAPAQAQGGGDAAVGRQKAQACTVCHGPLGVSSAPDAPNLAAQPAIYLAAQLRAYRSGERRHEVMSVMSKTLTDQDIDNLAAWYASLQIDVRQP